MIIKIKCLYVDLSWHLQTRKMGGKFIGVVINYEQQSKVLQMGLPAVVYHCLS